MLTVVNMEAAMHPSIEHRTISTPIGSLHVELRGQGPSVLCWPSLYCDARTVDALSADLGRDHQVVVVEGPGHGQSGTSPRHYTLEDCADAAIHVLDDLGIDRAIWIGPAWGGHVGIAAARRHARRLRGLVILNAPMASWRGGRLMLMRLTYLLLWIFGPRSFVARIVADKMIAPSAGPDRGALVDAVAEALGRCDKRGLLATMRSVTFGREDLVPFLPEIRMPTVFFAGAEDGLFPVAEARAQAAALPDCRFVVVERSAHQSALEAPEQVLPVTREFCAGLS
jgi:pimeloyl-ACP methyl ester carboxylesterase